MASDPPLADDLDPRELSSEVRDELRSLARPVAEEVSRRLVATAQLIDIDPELALSHALVARRKASRIAAVREAAGLAAYHAGEWQTAIGELRTYHRMSGKLTHLAVLADCERALGRPEKAIDLFRTADREQLDPQEIVELLIVAAGARSDMGQNDAAVAMLQVRELTSAPDAPWSARLRYAYADALLGAARRDEAREWFARAAELDEELNTDAAERLLELDGIVIEGDDEEEDDLDGDESESTSDEREAAADLTAAGATATVNETALDDTAVSDTAVAGDVAVVDATDGDGVNDDEDLDVRNLNDEDDEDRRIRGLADADDRDEEDQNTGEDAARDENIRPITAAERPAAGEGVDASVAEGEGAVGQSAVGQGGNDSPGVRQGGNPGRAVHEGVAGAADANGTRSVTFRSADADGRAT